MESVETKVRSTCQAGLVLSTPTGRGQFTVARVDSRGVVLLLGDSETSTPLSWECLEGVGTLLSGGAWLPIGGAYASDSASGTLDAYLKGCIKRATAGWVAVLLEHAGVVEIDRRRPARLRLRPTDR